MNEDRRSFLKQASGTVMSGALMAAPLAALAQSTGEAAPAAEIKPLGALTKHELPKLPYDYNALEPHIDAQTMMLHHDKHHQAYVDGLNKAELELAKARGAGDFALIQHWSRSLAFNYGGHFLHSLFWSIMGPGSGGAPSGALGDKINNDFGSFDIFQKQFSEAAAKVEGGGWAVLHYRKPDNRLVIGQIESQQKMAHWGATQLLALDVWEHAYYLKYQNKRADYIKAWWNVVNWNAVANNLAQGMK
jgi:Fe-Mn family superoxide dismutase